MLLPSFSRRFREDAYESCPRLRGMLEAQCGCAAFMPLHTLLLRHFIGSIAEDYNYLEHDRRSGCKTKILFVTSTQISESGDGVAKESGTLRRHRQLLPRRSARLARVDYVATEPRPGCRGEIEGSFFAGPISHDPLHQFGAWDDNGSPRRRPRVNSQRSDCRPRVNTRVTLLTITLWNVSVTPFSKISA